LNAVGDFLQGVTDGRPEGLVPFSMPFRGVVIDAPKLRKVNMPTFKLYDGTSDLDEHLRVYKAQMYVKDVGDVAYCRYFPTTLKRGGTILV